MNQAQSTGAKTEASVKKTKHRSPNYPGLTFTAAMEMARKVFDKDKKNPVSLDVLAKHLGFSSKENGSALTAISALKKYGLMVPAGDGLRISDDAFAIFVYPPNNPERTGRIKTLAMRPPIFGEVIKEYPDGLPSDENLSATLQHKWEFSAEAAATMIKVLRHAMEVSGSVEPVNREPLVEQGGRDGEPLSLPFEGVDSSGAGKTPSLPPQTKPPQPLGGQRETHMWKLGDGVWAEITISGRLTQKRLEKLKQYVSLLDFDEESGDTN